MAEQQCNAPFKANLCRIDPGLSPHQLQSFKAACITCLGLSRQKLEGATSFVAVYDLIEQARPHNAKSLVYKMAQTQCLTVKAERTRAIHDRG